MSIFGNNKGVGAAIIVAALGYFVDIYDLILFFSYNYIVIYTLLTFLKEEVVKSIIILKFKFVIYKLYLYKFINIIMNNIFIFTYKNQIKKSYIFKS